MRSKFFLVFDNSGGVRLTKTHPTLKGYSEVSVEMSVTVPDSLFRRPQLSATVEIADGAVSAPEVSVEMADDIRDAVKASTGVDLKIQIGGDT